MLVYRYGGIGDTLTLVPFLVSLRQRFANITLVGASERLALIPDELRDRVVSADLAARSMESLAAEHEFSIAFAAAPMRGFTRTLAPFPPPGRNVYAYMRDHAVVLGGDEREFIPPPAQGRGVIVHPGAGTGSKRVPFAEMRAILADRVGAQAEKSTVIFGPAEDAAEEQPWREAGCAIRRPGTLAEMAALIRSCAVFLGNDSGPMHLAALSGLKTFVRFTASDPAIWKPPGLVEIV